MDREFQQYRFARIEAHNITRFALEAQFKDGIVDPHLLDNAIEHHLTGAASTVAPWRQSPIERAACADGARLAALEFYWAHRHQLRPGGFKSSAPHECSGVGVCAIGRRKDEL